MAKSILSPEIPSENLILVAFNPKKDYWTGYDHVHVEVMYFDPKRDDYFFARDQWKFPGLDSFRISCQMGKSDTSVYGWSYGYSSIFYADLDELEIKVKLLRKIKLSYSRIVDRLGYPKTYGQYCVFLANTMNIDRIVVNKNPHFTDLANETKWTCKDASWAIDLFCRETLARLHNVDVDAVQLVHSQ